MTNIISICNNKEFFDYPKLEELLKDSRKNPMREITFTPALFDKRTPTKNVFVRVWRWIAMKVKMIWHSICLFCSKSYKKSYEEAADRIQNAKVVYLEEQERQQTAADKARMEALEAEILPQEELHRKYVALEEQLVIKHEELKQIHLDATDKTKSESNWNLLRFFTADYEARLSAVNEKIVTLTLELDEIKITYSHDTFTTQKAELEQLQKKYGQHETSEKKLIRLINEGTGSEKISTLFSALFHNFENPSDNIEKITLEDSKNIAVKLKREWKIWSPSREATDGVIITIHKELIFSLSENTVDITSNNRTGLQSALEMPWPLKHNTADIVQLRVQPAEKVDRLFMTVNVGFRKSVDDTYEYFLDLWGKHCIPIEDSFKGTYPYELQREGWFKDRLAEKKDKRT